MWFRDVWKCLQAAHHALNKASLERQDEAINDLFRFFESHREERLPVFLYEQAIQILFWYLERVLPAINYYEAEDRRFIAEDYRRLIKHLEESVAVSQQIEQAFEQLLDHVRTGIFNSIHDIAETFLKIAQEFFDLQDLKGFSEPFRSDFPFQEHLARLQENFRYEQALAFFQRVFDVFFEDSISAAISEYRLPMYNVKRFFEYVLEVYFQGKAVLVDNFQQGQIMPLAIVVDSEKTSEHVEFWNQNIDANMQVSADTARRLASRYLRDEYGKNVPDQMFVQCCFPKWDVRFKDRSASLLLGIRIIETVLGVKSLPATVVTGEVGRSGEVLKVGFINEKIKATSEHDRIERILIPEANLSEIKGSFPKKGTVVVPVRTFAEAVQQVLDYFRQDWGEAPGVDVFYGRQEELDTIQQWILEKRCRLLAVLGMGGMGKTTLTKKLAEQIKHRFQYLFWRDLRNAPPVEQVLDDCIKFLSDQQHIVLAEDFDLKISLLIEYLKKHRCLLVLDNLETLLQGGEDGRRGVFREGCDGYGMLLQRIGEIEHQSCLIITSREKPREFDRLEGKMVRALTLRGLEYIDAEHFLTDLHGTAQDRNRLIEHYGGHPLALKLAVAAVHNLFNGNIPAFLKEKTSFIGGIKALLEQQHEGLSKQEREVIYWLTLEREAVSFAGLRNDISNPVQRRKLPEVMEVLQRKSLIEITDAGFTLQPVVMEYMTEQLIQQVCAELSTGKIALFNSHALMKAQAKDLIRESQKRLIFRPIVENLEYEYELEQQEIEAALKNILMALRERRFPKPGYAAGNILNLLLYLNCDLHGYDFSNLPVWQAYLQGAELHDVNFTNVDLRGSVFTETFGNILSVAYSRDGKYLAAGTLSQEIRIWDAENYRQLQICAGHTGWVWSVAFSPDGKWLASGSQDHTVKLWEIATGESILTLDGHTTWVWSVVFNPDGCLLASGSDDGVKIWDVQTGQSLLTLQEQTQGVHAVTFSPDGKILVNGTADHTIQLWQIPAEEPLGVENIASLHLQKTLHGHTDRVRSVTFDSKGRILVSGSDDQTLRVWDVSSTQCLHTLYGHTALVKSLSFSSDGERLASSSDDRTILVWDVLTWQCLKTLQGHENWVWSVAFKPNTHLLASGASDQSVRIWNTESGQCINTIAGYTNRTLSVAFCPDGSQFASGHSDRHICLWNLDNGQWCCHKIFQGHTNWVMSVTFSPDGKTLASGSSDKSVRIWDVTTGKCLNIFRSSRQQEGHNEMVRAVAFSSDSKTLLSCSDDETLRIWDLQTGRCANIFRAHDWLLSAVFSPDDTLVAGGSQDHRVYVWHVTTETCRHIFNGHTKPVRSVAFCPDGRLLASGSEDQTVRLWDINSEECLSIFAEHTKSVRSVTFSPDGRLLASGSEDQTVRLWDVTTGACLTVLNCSDRHAEEGNWVWSVAFSPNGEVLVSGGEDGTIRLWNMQTRERLKTLHPERPYERTNINGVTGLTDAQKATLQALGAVSDGLHL